MNVKRQFAQSASWMVLGTSFNQLSTFAVFVVLSRILSPLEFGLVAFATLFIDLARPIVTTGISDAIIKDQQWSDERASTAFWLNVFAGLAVMMLIFAIGYPIILLTGHVSTAPFLVALTVTLFLESLGSLPTAILRRDFRYKALTKRTALTSTVGGIAGIAFALSGWGAWALVMQRVISVSTGLIALWVSAKWMPSLAFNREDARDVSVFASGLITSQLLSTINGQIAGLVIGIGIGPVALGLYRTGNRMLLMVTQLTITPIQRVALTAFARVKADGNIADVYRRLTGACALIACPAFIGVGAISYDLINVLFGSKWLDASMVMTVSSLLIGVQAINYFFTPALSANGNTRASVYYFLSAVIGNGVLGMIAVPFGFLAVVISQTVRAYLGLPISLVMLKREISLSPRAILGEVMPSFMAALVMGAAMMAAQHYVFPTYSSLARLLILVPFGGFVYVTLLLIFARKTLRQHFGEVFPLLPGFVRKRLEFAV